VHGPAPLSAIPFGSFYLLKSLSPDIRFISSHRARVPIHRQICPPTFLSLTRARMGFSRRSLIVDGPFPSPPWSWDDINSSHGPGQSHSKGAIRHPSRSNPPANLRSPGTVLSGRYSGRLSARAAGVQWRRLRSATASPAPVAPLSLYQGLLSVFTPILNNPCQWRSTKQCVSGLLSMGGESKNRVFCDTNSHPLPHRPDDTCNHVYSLNDRILPLA
jgi:hypothetical protein